MMTMAGEERSSIQTRPSLLNRLKAGDDAESWQEFYRVYGKLGRDFSIQAGLIDTEADEVVQDTAIAVSRHLPEFSYDPKVCRFKTCAAQSDFVADQGARRERGKRICNEASHRGGVEEGNGTAGARDGGRCAVEALKRLAVDKRFITETRSGFRALSVTMRLGLAQGITDSLLARPERSWVASSVVIRMFWPLQSRLGFDGL